MAKAPLSLSTLSLRTTLGLTASGLAACILGRNRALSATPDPALTRLAAPWITPPLLPPIREQDALLAIAHVGPVSDGGWSTVHNEAVAAVRAAFPRLRTVWVENVPYSADATRLLRQFVAEGANLVLATADYGDFLMDVAGKARDVAFVQCNSTRLARNASWYYVAQWYPCYILGVAAGLLSRTGQIGYIASFPLPSVYASANAYLLGARSVRPDATVRVVSINAWFDPQASLSAATALADSGCDVLCGIMDEAGYLRLAQKRGLWAIMSNNDERAYGPDAYLSSVVYDFRQHYVDQVRARLEGRWTPMPCFLPLGAGADRDAWGARVPESVRRQADAVRSRILEGWSPFIGPIHDHRGHLRVPAGETMDDLALYQWHWAVDGVLGLE